MLYFSENETRAASIHKRQGIEQLLHGEGHTKGVPASWSLPVHTLVP